MIKPLIGKLSLFNTALAFSASLAVLLLLPLTMGAPQPSLLQGVAQAATIVALVGVILVFAGGRENASDDEAPSPGENGVAQRTETDGLTHGLNQRGLTVRLLELIALGERYGNELSIAAIGVDHYEDVVEKYGQDVGDKALVAISSELADSLRMPDVLGRWEDDQFVAILPETPLDGARHIGERMREAVARARFDGGRGVVLSMTASIGVTVFRAGDDLQSLLSRATRAMNLARSQGRDRVSTDLAA